MVDLRRMFGMLGAPRSAPDPRPMPQPPRLIPSGPRHPELCMLAGDVQEQYLDDLHGGKKRIVQLKADGIRALYIDGRIVSRDGVPLDCALHCQPGLRRLEEAFGQAMMFDGEYVEPEGFQATLSAQRRREGHGVLWLFDAIPFDRWEEGGWEASVDTRLTLLKHRFPAAQSSFVGLLDAWTLDAYETRAKAREVWELGFEGVVTKDPDSSYVRDRSDEWRKLKQHFVHVAPIVDVLEKGGRLKHIIVQGSDGRPPITIGTGWDQVLARTIIRDFKMGYRMKARISFELTTGVKRSIRGARFESLETGGART